MVLFATAHGVGTLIVARVVQGIGSGRATVTLKPGEQRTGVELIVARR
jgi:hypothetical protein